MFVHFEKISWKNLASTGNNSIEIDLSGTGTTTFYGKSGAGKSTILDAITFCLFGKPFREVNKKSLINSVNRKALSTEVEFTINKIRYKVIRGISPDTFEIYSKSSDDYELLPQNGDSRSYQEILESKILGFNHKTFVQIVILSIMNYVPYMKLKTAERREFVDDLLDIHVFTRMNDSLKKLISQNKSHISTIDSDIASVRSMITSKQSQIEKISSSKNQSTERSEQQIEEIKQQINELREKEESLFSLISELSEEQITHIEKIKSRRSSAKTALIEQRTKIGSLKSDRQFFTENDHCPTCKQSITEEYSSDVVSGIDEKLSKMDQLFVRVQSDITTFDAEIDAFEEVVSNNNKVNSEISQVRREVVSLVKDIERIKQSMNDNSSSFDELIVGLQSEISEHEEKLQELSNELNKAYKQKKLYDVSAQILKENGVKTSIIQFYIPLLNNEINFYLDQLGLPVQFTLDENFDEKILSRYRDGFTYEHFSAGEKSRINIALTFAWRKIAEMKNTLNTNILFIDELLDSSLGDAEVEVMVDILRDMGEKQRIFVTTHRHVDLMKDVFDNSIKFEKVGNFTEISPE